MENTIKNIIKETGLKHIAVIMDGNRRWAANYHLPSAVGHKKGVESLREIIRACDDFGIKYITVYAFSSENWNRKPEEVSFLMNLVAETLSTELDEMHKEHVKIRFIGRKDKLSDGLKKIIADSEEKTKNNTGVVLQIAFNYGARAEIVDAVKSVIEKGLPFDKIDEKTFSEYLYTAGVPDPDLLIRTGGEKRISNYLLWQIAYSEIIVRDEYWPEFNKKSLSECIVEFGRRQRRYGK